MKSEKVREQAFRDYQEGMKYKEIAEKYGVSLSTVKSWASRYWKKGCNLEEKKLQPKGKKVATEEKSKRAVAEDVGQVLENADLTDKQRLFCLYYVRCFNATKAYQKAYGSSYDVANSEGYRLLVNPCIRDEIMKLKQNRLNRELLDEHDIFQKYMDIAFADMTDYVSFGRETVPVMGAFGPITVTDEKTGEKIPLTKEINVVKFRKSTDVDGTLIAEVKQGKDGASVKLMDRMKAMNWLTDHMDLATEEQRARIAVLKAKANVAEDEDAAADDGFLAALNGTAGEDWSDEAD